MIDRKDKILYGSLLFVVVVLFVLRACSFDYGFFSLWDEAYLLLKCRNAYDGVMTAYDSSIWAFIAAKWFPYLDLTNEVQSSWASLLLLLCGVANMIAASVWIKGKKKVLKYLAIFALVTLPILSGFYASEMPHRMGWGTIMNYVVIQSFLLMSSLSAFLVASHTSKEWVRYSSFFITGIFCGLALFVILPSAALILLAYFVMIWVMNYHDYKQAIYACVAGLSGVLAACLYIHLFVMDLQTVWECMIHTSQTITKWGVGYTPLSFILQVWTLLKSVFVSGAYVFIVYLAAKELSKYNKFIAGSIYIALIVFAIAYLHSYFDMFPASCMFITSILVPCMYSWYERSIQMQVDSPRRRWQNVVWIVFLLLVPVLASMGTNTVLYGRIACFMGAWVFLYIMYEDQIDAMVHRFVIITALVCLLLPLSYNMARTYHQRYTLYTESLNLVTENASKLHLTKAQASYYKEVHDIIAQYGYQPKQSILFASIRDWATAYILDLKLSNEFQLSTVFKFLPEEEFLLPDFIILTDEEKSVYDFEKFSWGWPEQYDVYQIGSPETICNKFNGGAGQIRWLYCRK